MQVFLKRTLQYTKNPPVSRLKDLFVYTLKKITRSSFLYSYESERILISPDCTRMRREGVVKANDPSGRMSACVICVVRS